MKLFNLTKLDDKILKQLLYAAAKKTGMGVRTSKVVVKVSKGNSAHGSVRPTRGWGYYVGWLKGKPRKKWTLNDHQVLYSDGGTMLLWIFLPSSSYLIGKMDTITIAEKIYSLAAHEWKHVADLQKKKHFGQYNRNWGNRPHERRAIAAAQRADRKKNERPDIQDAIINLAINIEEALNGKK